MTKAELLKKLETWPDDMPIFSIIGLDALAAVAIDHWIDEAVAAGVNFEKIDSARVVRAACANYPGQRLPD